MAILIGIGLVVLVIAGFIAYWIVMIALFLIGALFVFWAVVFAFVFKDPYIGSLCSVFATLLTLWVWWTRPSRQKSV